MPFMSDSGVLHGLPAKSSANSSPLTSPDGTPSELSRRPVADVQSLHSPSRSAQSHSSASINATASVSSFVVNSKPDADTAPERVVEDADGNLWGVSNPPTSSELLKIYGTRPLRAQFACDYCRRRKAKCSGTEPCTRCVAKNRECVFSTVRNQRKVAVSLKDVRADRHAQMVPGQSGVKTSVGSLIHPALNRRVVVSQGAQGTTSAEWYLRHGALDRPPRFNVYSSQSTPNLSESSISATSFPSRANTVFTPPTPYHSFERSSIQEGQANHWALPQRGWTEIDNATNSASTQRQSQSGQYGLGLYLDSRYSVPANQYASPETWSGQTPQYPYLGQFSASPPAPAQYAYERPYTFYPSNASGVADFQQHSATQSLELQSALSPEGLERDSRNETTGFQGSSTLWPNFSTLQTSIKIEGQDAGGAAALDGADDSLGFRPPTP